MEVKVCYDLMCARVLGHWTWEMKKQRWPWLEASLADYFMSVFKCAHTRPCWWLRWPFAARGYINRGGAGSSSPSLCGWRLLVLVRIPRRSQVDFCASLSLSQFVCEVLAPADASEMERSDRRHVPAAEVRGHRIQTHPQKLSVREHRGLWDHLTTTITHNIIYNTPCQSRFLSSAPLNFTSSVFKSQCC